MRRISLLPFVLLPLAGCPFESFDIPEVVRSSSLSLELAPSERAELTVQTTIASNGATAGEFRIAVTEPNIGAYTITAGVEPDGLLELLVSEGSSEPFRLQADFDLCPLSSCSIAVPVSVTRTDESATNGSLRLSFSVSVSNDGTRPPDLDLIDIVRSEE